MVTERMIEEAMRAYKETLKGFCETAPEGALSMESARVVAQGTQEALASAERAAFKTYLESKECPEGEVRAWDQSFRFKYVSDKVRSDAVGGAAGVGAGVSECFGHAHACPAGRGVGHGAGVRRGG